MKTSVIFVALALLLLAGCTTKETKNYVTNNTGPADWQPPLLTWQSPLDAEVRGTVGLDVRVTDSSHVDSVLLYVDGLQTRMLHDTLYRFSLITDSLLDGVHLCEARAFDHYGNLGISPVLRVNVMNSMAQGPRLLWVPDDFATIQAAINASEDYDTIRVRDGTYYETLNTFGKGIWIESEHGPKFCVLNGKWSSSAIFVLGGPRTVTIRGLQITAADYGIGLGDGALVGVFNNWFVVTDSLEYSTGIISSYAGGHIRNNLLSGSHYGVQLGYFWGDFTCNIVQDMTDVGMWNATTYLNPIVHSYNDLWNNPLDYANGFARGQGEILENPLWDALAGQLLPGSPCTDAGDSTVVDRNGTRSDIGPTGGPWAY
jgi:hypothetical protein